VINRRQWLRGLGLAITASVRTMAAHALSSSAEESKSQPATTGQPLPLADYEPKSTLHAEETRVERAAFPVVDVHTHITMSARS